MRTIFLATMDFSRLSEGIGVCADAAASRKQKRQGQARQSKQHLGTPIVRELSHWSKVDPSFCRIMQKAIRNWAQVPDSNRWSGFNPRRASPAGASRAGNRPPPLTIWPGTPISAARGSNVSPAPDTAGSTAPLAQSWPIPSLPRKPPVKSPAARRSTSRGARACAARCARWRRRSRLATALRPSPPGPGRTRHHSRSAERHRAPQRRPPQSLAARARIAKLANSLRVLQMRSAGADPGAPRHFVVDCCQTVAILSRRSAKSTLKLGADYRLRASGRLIYLFRAPRSGERTCPRRAK